MWLLWTLGTVYFPTQADTTENWYKGGAARSKTLVGLATYGRTFKLADPSDNGVGARAIGGGDPGKYSNVSGYLTYFEVGIIYTEMTCCISIYRDDMLYALSWVHRAVCCELGTQSCML